MTAPPRPARERSAPIRRRRLYEQVAERLEVLINEGVYAPGAELPSERALMAEFGVGRPAIREALFALQKMGLLHLSAGERPRVREPAHDVIIDSMRGALNRFMTRPGGMRHFQRARLFFEIGIAREVAEHASAADLDAIALALENNRAALPSARRFEETDVAFHLALATAAHNPLFLVIHEAMFEWLYSQRTVTLSVAGQAAVALAAHERIAEAITARDPEAAGAAMRAHLEQGHRLYWAIMEPGTPEGARRTLAGSADKR